MTPKDSDDLSQCQKLRWFLIIQSKITIVKLMIILSDDQAQ